MYKRPNKEPDLNEIVSAVLGILLFLVMMQS